MAAIAIPRFAKTQENAKRSADEATARTIVSAINMATASGDLKMRETATEGTYELTDSDDSSLNSEGIMGILKADYLEEDIKPQWKGDNFVINPSGGSIVIDNDEDPADQLYPAE